MSLNPILVAPHKKLQATATRQLRTLGHKLKPVVRIGNAGLTASVLNEIGLSLAHHELIKIKVSVADRIERNRIIDEICGQTRAELIQRIGHIALIYLRNREKQQRIVLG